MKDRPTDEQDLRIKSPRRRLKMAHCCIYNSLEMDRPTDGHIELLTQHIQKCSWKIVGQMKVLIGQIFMIIIVIIIIVATLGPS